MKTGRVTERDEDQVQAAVEQLALIFTDWGFPRMPSRVLVTLMAADEEALTAADLAGRLGVSPAAISGAVRYLSHVGLLQRVPTPGSRRDRYRLPADPWYESASLKDGFMSQVAAASDDGVKALGTDSPGGERIARMRDFFVFVQGELGGLLARWRAENPPGRRVP
jgi:DNA-binding transcriptional regulator GbsR (MarR family)